MQRFGLFCYHSNNLGDEIQSIAASQFLPRIDEFIDRDNTPDFQSRDGRQVKLIMNGWYALWPESWPPSPDILPLLISMHLSRSKSNSGKIPAEVMLRGAGLDYFHQGQPVGARDLDTLDVLQASGIDAYHSACLSLTLQRPAGERKAGRVLINDVPEQVAEMVREVAPEAEVISQLTLESRREPRFGMAMELLHEYAEASFVVTSRLHCALPCLAFGTPVALITSAKDQSRFRGLENLLHMYGRQDFQHGLPFDVFRPLPNKPNFKAHVTHLVRRCVDFVGDDHWSSDAGEYRAFSEHFARRKFEVSGGLHPKA